MTLFGQQVKKLRIEKNLSQDALAEKLFISRQSISKWENGDATPDLEHLIQLANIFDVSLDYLVHGKEAAEGQKEEDADFANLELLKGREFVLNPEIGKYEKRDGMTIFLDILSEYWMVLAMIIIIVLIFIF